MAQLDVIKNFKKLQLDRSIRRQLSKKFLVSIAKAVSTGQPMSNTDKKQIKSMVKEYEKRKDKLKKANTLAKLNKVRNSLR